MPRLITVLAAVCSLSLYISAKPPVVLASSNSVAHVMVRLQGSPAAADPNFRDRSRSASGRLRFDSSLASFHWYTGALSNYQAREIVYLNQQGIDLKVTRQYSLLFNGFSATVPKAQLSRLRRLGNVVAVTPIRRYYPLDASSLPLVHAPEAWSQLGGPTNTGKGLKIAQVDSGIDIHNPCFKDNGYAAPVGFPRGQLDLTNNKVIVARAFGPQAGKTYSPADSGGADSGHGTFGAAIEGCDYNTPTPLGENISGVAPDAYLMNYNVFPGGSASDNQDVDPVLSALQSALLDYPDVINMSLGLGLGAGDLRLDPDATAVGLVIQAGITVVVSAGNDGPTPQSVSSPAALPQAIAVGSTSNSRGVSSSVLVNGPADVPTNLQRIRADEMSHAWTGTVGPAQVVDVGLGRRPGDSVDDPKADDYAGKNVKGKIVLMERGNGNSANYIFIRTKIQRAQDAGAVGAIMYDNRQELNPGSPDQGKTTLNSMFVSYSDGTALVQWIRDHPDATLSMDSSLASYPEAENVLSDFSSRGYGANYAIKPDLVAPGQDIYSATQTLDPSSSLYNSSGFLSESGTSFSAPHVSGAAALVLQKHPKWTPDQVKSSLMDTAGFGISPGYQQTGTPTIMQIGGGLLDINSALSSSAYLSPASVSFGELNVGSGAVTKSATVSINNISAGVGTWSASVHELHASPGVSVSVPASVNLSGAKADVPIKVSAASATPEGNYDGYAALTRNGETVHLVYFVHVVSNPVKAGTILLVDASTSLFQPPAPAPSVPHVDVAPWYAKTLTVLGKPYTLWNEAIMGTPSLADLQAASAVIYFTGTNLNDLASENTNTEALAGPLSSADVTVMHSYMDAGGRLFVSGMGAPLSDPYWSGIVMGGVPSGDDLSVYDNSKNDKNTKGGISPPKPSAIVDKKSSEVRNPWIFGGLKAIDFSTKGDGARDNLASFNSGLAGNLGDGLIGVPGLVVIRGSNGFQGNAYGQGALQTSKASLTTTGSDVGVVSSDEPSLTHRASYKGRSVMFSFGFEGINNNTGYATRAQVMKRILQWFTDKPVAHVTGRQYKAKRLVQLRGSLHFEKAVEYRWQVGSQTLKTTSNPTTYRFSHPGKYRLRVQITDFLGHVAVSGWATVTVR